MTSAIRGQSRTYRSRGRHLKSLRKKLGQQAFAPLLALAVSVAFQWKLTAMSILVSASHAAQSISSDPGVPAGLSSPGGAAVPGELRRAERQARPCVQMSGAHQVITDQLAFDAVLKGAHVSASDLPPDSNTGGKISPTLESLFHQVRLLDIKEGREFWRYWILADSNWYRGTVRLPVDQTAFVDTLTFSFRESSFQSLPSCSGFVSDADLCVMVGEVLRDLIGVSVSGPVGSRNLYAHSRALVSAADDSIRAGFIAAGGNNDTVCVHLTGEGCALLGRAQWVALYSLLESLHARITRVDLAHDDYQGVHSVDDAVDAYKSGAFKGRGRPPSVSVRGDWLSGDGDKKGRTLYVGTRESGKLLRVYEKGRELGDESSPWVRWELELRSEDRVIPAAVLLRPGEYLAGAYPNGGGTGWISEAQSAIKTIGKALKISYAAMIGHCRKSYGKLLFAMRDIEGSADAVLDILTEGVFDVPRRLIVPPLPL
jgi:DNA relaxase NicK